MARDRRRERGVALAYVAIFFAVILGITALGIDLGRLAHTANEVQTVADAAARGGAKSLLDNGGTPGFGITTAHIISGQNWMNGSAPADSDVLVDEGSFNVATGQFECCTSNSPCCSGGSPYRGLTCIGSTSCTRTSAVLAAPRTTVDNMFAGVFDFISNGRLTNTPVGGTSNGQTPIARIAVAHASGPAGGCQAPTECPDPTDWGCYCDHGVAPCLPLATSVCEFPDGCVANNCLPQLTVSNNISDSACWTGFTNNANDNVIRGLMAQGPCQPNGQSNQITLQTSGETINLINGMNTNGNNNVFDLAQCLAGLSQPQPQGCALDANGNIIPGARGSVFTIPIFDNGSACPQQCNQSGTVVGFATIQITGYSAGPPRTLDIQAKANVSSTENQSGGACLGTDCRVVMAR